jgi:TonB family protein
MYNNTKEDEMQAKIATIREHATERLQVGVIGALGAAIVFFAFFGSFAIKPLNVKPVSGSDIIDWGATTVENIYNPPPINNKVVEITKAAPGETADTMLPGNTNTIDPGFIGGDRLHRTIDDVNIPPVNAIKPQLIGKMDIKYPEMMRKLEVEGLVVVGAALDEQGLVFDTRIMKSSGYPELDNAAVEAVRNARFTPAMQGEKPIAVKIAVPVNFKLTSN